MPSEPDDTYRSMTYITHIENSEANNDDAKMKGLLLLNNMGVHLFSLLLRILQINYIDLQCRVIKNGILDSSSCSISFERGILSSKLTRTKYSRNPAVSYKKHHRINWEAV